MTKQQNTINLVRSIMRASGKTQVWNNKYDDGLRTVKCYRDKCPHGSSIPCVDTMLKNVLTQTLTKLRIKHEIKLTEPSSDPFNPGTGGFIVKLPAED